MNTPIDQLLPTASDIWGWILEINGYGPRLTGSDAQAAYTEFLATEFAAAGLKVERDQFLLDRRDVISVDLRAEFPGTNSERIDVASFYPESGTTPSGGVSGQVVYVGDVHGAHGRVRNVEGKIVLVDCSFETSAIHDQFEWHIHNPAGEPPMSWKMGSKCWWPLETLRSSCINAGAVGLVAAWTNICEDNATGQYQPNLPYSVTQLLGANLDSRSMRDLVRGRGNCPGLWIGRRSRDRILKLLQQFGESLRMTLTLNAQMTPRVPTETVVAMLPGSTDEAVVLVTHGDGGNAIQENGGLGFLTLAKCFAKQPPSARKRSLVFAVCTGHFTSATLYDVCSGVPTFAETEGLLERHPWVASRAAAAVSLEHLGVKEWLDDGNSYRPSGRHGWARCVTSNAVLAGLMIDALTPSFVYPLRLVDGPQYGMPRPLAKRGIPTLSYANSSPSVMSVADHGHLAKLSKERMHGELSLLAQWLVSLDKTPTSKLHAAVS